MARYGRAIGVLEGVRKADKKSHRVSGRSESIVRQTDIRNAAKSLSIVFHNHLFMLQWKQVDNPLSINEATYPKDRGIMKRVALYARVSTTDKKQDPEMQLAELRAFCLAREWQIVGEYTDYCSGAKESRPELNKLVTGASQRAFDIVLVWKLDRFARSLKHLVTAVSQFEALGISFVSLRDQIDMTTPAGRLMFQIIGAMAEFERSLIVERTRAGISRARAKGKRLGRPQRLNSVSRTTLWRRAKANKQDYLADV